MGHREELLAGAKRAIYEKGYANATARDIVALSGTNLGSIGYHYGSTQALLTAAMISAMEDWGATLEAALSAADPPPTAAELAAGTAAAAGTAGVAGTAGIPGVGGTAGVAGTAGLGGAGGVDQADPMLRFWRRVIGSIAAHRPLWLASVEVMTAAERNDELRALLAGAIQEGRRGMAAIVTGVPEDQLDEATVRTVGAMQMALMSGVVTQWLTDPSTAPSAEEIVAGVRGLSRPRTTPSPA